MPSLRELAIPGVWLASTPRNTDARGWLVETFRDDWMPANGPVGHRPAMSYVSYTKPGVARGPHEHSGQTDLLVFPGPSDFRVYLWDNRGGSPAFGRRVTMVLGETDPALLVVPPGVVHGYRNIGDRDGLVLNYPDRLFRGPGQGSAVDEVRHESDPESRFDMEAGE